MQEIYNLFSPIFLTIWPLNFYWYGLFYAISFYFWYVFIFKNLKKKYEISEKEFDKIFFWISVCALIWWRLWHVFFYDFQYYSQNLLEIFQVWKWWMASHWWIIWAVIWFLIFRKNFNLKFYFPNFLNPKQASPTKLVSKNLKNKILNFFTLSSFDKKLLDLFAISWAFWFWLWRLWNFINWELFWKIFEKIDSENFFSFLNFICVDFWDWVCRHPVQIYSSLANFLIFWILFFLLQKKFFWQKENFFQQEKNFWKIFYLFLFFFWVQRFFLEFLKEDFVWNNYFEILTTGQIFSVFMILIWGFLFWNNNFFCKK